MPDLGDAKKPITMLEAIRETPRGNPGGDPDERLRRIEKMAEVVAEDLHVYRTIADKLSVPVEQVLGCAILSWLVEVRSEIYYQAEVLHRATTPPPAEPWEKPPE